MFGTNEPELWTKTGLYVGRLLSSYEHFVIEVIEHF